MPLVIATKPSIVPFMILESSGSHELLLADVAPELPVIEVQQAVVGQRLLRREVLAAFLATKVGVFQSSFPLSVFFDEGFFLARVRMAAVGSRVGSELVLRTERSIDPSRLHWGSISM